MNKKVLQQLIKKLKSLPLLIFPITLIILLIMAMLGLTMSDTFIISTNYNKLYDDNLNITIINTIHEKKHLNVEVAQTTKQIEQGLMSRDYLEDSSGMLFIFNDSQTRIFWMKNTLIPLDIIFIDHNKKIINIARNATPLDETIGRYKSAKAARFVLEVNGGWAEKNNVSNGNRILF